ncbi:hypothetical protein [Pendulispora albinea]|uniref:Uncharacterized protein n=1 Tax=Pendulispora albinea TaxID=2741071 RepID=A0ABZ2LSE6_9BACT
MTAELELPKNPAIGLKDFDTSDEPTYTDEEPNALPPELVPEFLRMMKKRWPQHYAMTFLGIVTGWRPSTMRSLRRKGDKPDVLWKVNRILARRSNPIGQSVMNKTKTGKRHRAELPKEAMDVLAEHVRQLESRP